MLTRRAFFGLLVAAPVAAQTHAPKIDKRLFVCLPNDHPINCEWKQMGLAVVEGDKAITEVYESVRFYASDKERAKKWLNLIKKLGNALGHAQAACKLDKF